MSALSINTDAPGVVQDTSDAAQRSRMYALLSDAFAYPTADVATRLLNGELQQALNETIVLLQLPTEQIPNQLPEHLTTRNELQMLYTRLFEVSTGAAQVSSVERRYGGGPEQKLWEKLLRFYTFFGLDFSSGSSTEQPDHLLTQLAFMHYLCFLEAGAQGSTNNVRNGQRDFLSMHLGRWVGGFTEVLERQSQAEPYTEFGRLLVMMVTTDMQQLGSSALP